MSEPSTKYNFSEVKAEVAMKALLPANLAAKLLMDNGMDEQDAWGALHWADEHGHYSSRRYTIDLVFSSSGAYAYSVSIY